MLTLEDLEGDDAHGKYLAGVEHPPRQSQPSSPNALEMEATTRPTSPTGAYQMKMLPGAESPLIQPKPNPLTRLRRTAWPGSGRR